MTIITTKMRAYGLAVEDRVHFGTPYGDPYVIKSIKRVTQETSKGIKDWYEVRFTLAGKRVNGGLPYYYEPDDMFDVEV